MPPSKVYIFGPNSSISRTVDEELTKSNYDVIWLGTKSPEWMVKSRSQFKKIDYEGTSILDYCKECLFFHLYCPLF